MANFLNSINLPEVSRPILEAEIERLIDLLDQVDDDPDIEPEGLEEPWLGAPERSTGSWNGLWPEGNDDREEDDSDREQCCEDEGAYDDAELEPEDEWFDWGIAPSGPTDAPPMAVQS